MKCYECKLHFKTCETCKNEVLTYTTYIRDPITGDIYTHDGVTKYRVVNLLFWEVIMNKEYEKGKNVAIWYGRFNSKDDIPESYRVNAHLMCREVHIGKELSDVKITMNDLMPATLYEVTNNSEKTRETKIFHVLEQAKLYKNAHIGTVINEITSNKYFYIRNLDIIMKTHFRVEL